MRINNDTMKTAAAKGIITPDQADRLWTYLQQEGRNEPRFSLTHILYYLGGLIAIGAMTLFMTLGWERYGGWGIFCIALAYAALGIGLAEKFIARDLDVPGGIMGAFVVALTPLAIYGLQQGLGFWDDTSTYRDYHHYIRWNWILMESGTLAAGAVLLRRYRLPFLVMPVAATLWYMSMDLTPFLFGELDYSWELRKLVSVYFGLGLTLFAFWIDLRSKREKDFAFWLYLFGVATFWGGLSLMNSDSELNKFLYMCINLFMIFIGVLLGRRVFAVFGGIGIAGYLGHLSYDVFADSLLFPFALSIIGLLVISLGVIWQKHEEKLTRKLRSRLPAGMRELLDNTN